MLSEIDRLKERVSRLEYRESQIISLFRDPDSMKPLAHFILENDLDREQSAGITDVVENAYQTLTAQKQLDASDFERQLSPYIPEKQKPVGRDRDFIKGVLMMCQDTGRWSPVVEHFRREYNVPVLRGAVGK